MTQGVRSMPARMRSPCVLGDDECTPYVARSNELLQATSEHALAVSHPACKRWISKKSSSYCCCRSKRLTFAMLVGGAIDVQAEHDLRLTMPREARWLGHEGGGHGEDPRQARSLGGKWIEGKQQHAKWFASSLCFFAFACSPGSPLGLPKCGVTSRCGGIVI